MLGSSSKFKEGSGIQALGPQLLVLLGEVYGTSCGLGGGSTSLEAGSEFTLSLPFKSVVEDAPSQLPAPAITPTARHHASPALHAGSICLEPQGTLNPFSPYLLLVMVFSHSSRNHGESGNRFLSSDELLIHDSSQEPRGNGSQSLLSEVIAWKNTEAEYRMKCKGDENQGEKT